MNDVKKLKQQMKVIESRLMEISSEKERVTRYYVEERNKLRDVIDQILWTEKHPNYEVSDHAIVRYMERVLQMDIEELKLRIFPQSERDRLNSMGFMRGKTAIRNELGACQAVVKDRTVVTLLDN